MHKHRWRDLCHDRFAYTPVGITALDVQGQLEQFCAECGIACSARLGALPAVQKGLFDDL
jgi:hypothetical protein